jgi:MFS family permease
MPAMGGRVQVHLPPTLRSGGPFRLLFAGQALSVVGDRITPVAIAFAVLGLGNATDLGIVLAAAGIPFALFAVAGGVVSDRVGRREVMIASDVVRTLSQAATAVLLLTGTAEVWMLVVLSAVYGTAAAVFMPALMGLIPQTVPPDRLQEANALLGFTRSVASVAGPALAGILIAIGGPGDAIALDALTFALSAACLIALRPERAAAHDEDDDPFTARLRAGWREVRARPWLTYGLAAMAAYHVFVLPAVWILGPALAKEQLSGASSWAIIVACFGLGTVAGNLVALRARIRRPVLVAAVALLGAATQAVIIGSGLGTAGIAALELVAGVAVSLFFTMWDTSIQEQVPPQAISRVSSYDFSVSLGLMPLGMAVAGPIAEAVGLQETLVAMSALGMLAALAWLAVPDVRRVRREEPEAEAVPAAAPMPAPDLQPEPAAGAGAGLLGPGADDGLRFERGRFPVEER